MRYLGVDYGAKKTGLALSDEGGRMGFPHAIVATGPRLADELVALIERAGVGAVVVGESRDLAGGDNAIAPAARALGAAIALKADVPVYYEPEFYTSQQARRAPEKEQKTRREAAREPVDAAAAALILTSYLEKQHGI
ncbi:MAG: Holliday junction resolvase RuvX [Patescibacteria group bacterium]|nr:Holliday junction resolvase RuvX [Patescibacteria group bacterium]MDE1944124.1 Holliday junction resolvase RuvX [Patescibacteria group bacterium]MDE1944745.1 Holliday junction resolvase RuvX [Patescibacteria group bacterium]MDE2058072.1 Holliday junction resolvase RuvX [Patescibacteria group bacterium]